MSNALRIAVVGAGIGAEHIKGYQELPELFEIKVLCDVQIERAARLQEAATDRPTPTAPKVNP